MVNRYEIVCKINNQWELRHGWVALTEWAVWLAKMVNFVCRQVFQFWTYSLVSSSMGLLWIILKTVHRCRNCQTLLIYGSFQKRNEIPLPTIYHFDNAELRTLGWFVSVNTNIALSLLPRYSLHDSVKLKIWDFAHKLNIWIIIW